MNEQRRQMAEAISANRTMNAGTVSVMLLSAVFFSGCEKKKAAPAGPPPPTPVTVVEVQPTDVPLTGEWVGTLDGYVNAQIQPQASGYLIKQNYREGSQVSKGQVLFEIDPRPFQAALDQAKGQQAQAQGQVAQAQAQLGLAVINVNRDTPLAQARRAHSITIRSRKRRRKRPWPRPRRMSPRRMRLWRMRSSTSDSLLCVL